jgi:HEAT repeat protein
MQTWSVNLKKCSTAKTIAIAAFATGLLFCSHSQASQPDSASLASSLLSDIRHSKSNSFDPLLSDWELEYGTQAVPALLLVAKNKSASDSERYVAVMGVAKIGGKASAPLLSAFLKDACWMIRNGTLRALTALKHPETAKAVLPLLKDPALVVRLEAIQSVEKLHPEGTPQALLATIEASENYHHGKAQWVPQRALEALRHLEAQKEISQVETQETASRLSAILENPKDPALKPEIEATLRRFTSTVSQ